MTTPKQSGLRTKMGAHDFPEKLLSCEAFCYSDPSFPQYLSADTSVTSAMEGAEANTDSPAAAAGKISIACILYNPSTEGDEGAEVVTLVLSSAMNTRGFNLYDKGSGTIIRLPAGDQPSGELEVLNPGKGIWNNGGDTIYLRRGEEDIDEWDYTDSVVSGEDITICRYP